MSSFRIRGWLIVFVLWACVEAGRYYRTLQTATRLLGVGEVSPYLIEATVLGLLCGGMICLLVLGVALLFRKSAAPRYWCWVLAIMLPMLILELSIWNTLTFTAARLRGVAAPPTQPTANRMLPHIVLTGVWLGYWLKSKRVSVTYGYTGFRSPN